MKRIAVFPGSFDPFTLGHFDIVERAIPIFDEIIIAIGVNSEKKGHQNIEERINFIQRVFKNKPTVSVKSYRNLTVDFCIENKATFILRGLRNGTDFEYEQKIAMMNQEIGNGIETIFIISSPAYVHLNSSVVREVAKYGKDISHFLPKPVE